MKQLTKIIVSFAVRGLLLMTIAFNVWGGEAYIQANCTITGAKAPCGQNNLDVSGRSGPYQTRTGGKIDNYHNLCTATIKDARTAASNTYPGCGAYVACRGCSPIPQ